MPVGVGQLLFQSLCVAQNIWPTSNHLKTTWILFANQKKKKTCHHSRHSTKTHYSFGWFEEVALKTSMPKHLHLCTQDNRLPGTTRAMESGSQPLSSVSLITTPTWSKHLLERSTRGHANTCMSTRLKLNYRRSTSDQNQHGISWSQQLHQLRNLPCHLLSLLSCRSGNLQDKLNHQNASLSPLTLSRLMSEAGNTLSNGSW